MKVTAKKCKSKLNRQDAKTEAENKIGPLIQIRFKRMDFCQFTHCILRVFLGVLASWRFNFSPILLRGCLGGLRGLLAFSRELKGPCRIPMTNDK